MQISIFRFSNVVLKKLSGSFFVELNPGKLILFGSERAFDKV